MVPKYILDVHLIVTVFGPQAFVKVLDRTKKKKKAVIYTDVNINVNQIKLIYCIKLCDNM